MSTDVTVHHVKADGNEPEHLKVTVGDAVVWRVDADDVRENDWPLLVHAIGSAVAATVQHVKEANEMDICDAPRQAIERLGWFSEADLLRAYEDVQAVIGEHPDRAGLETVANVLIHLMPPAMVHGGV